MIRFLWKRFFWDYYDNLVSNMVINFLWFFLSLPFLFLVSSGLLKNLPLKYSLILISVTYLLIAPPTVAIYHTVKLTPEGIRRWAATFGKGLWKLAPRAICFFLINGIFLILFAFNLKFYLSFAIQLKLLGSLLTGITFCLLVAYLLLQNYTFPLLVHTELSLKDVYKYAFFLTFNNLFFTLFVSFNLVVILTLLLLSIIGLPLFLITTLATFQDNALKTVLKKHGYKFKEDERYERGLIDLLRPWRSGVPK
jgi:hypothetical protein